MTENLFDKAKNMGLENIPYSDDISVLTKEIDFGDGVAKNRIAIQPMEGCDGEKSGVPGELTERRYLRFAKSGAGIIWLEATAVVDEGRANPRQLFMNENNIDAFKRMIENIKNTAVRENGFAPIVIMQATHSGRYSKPNGFPEPIIGYNIGAGNYARVKRLFRSILLCTAAVGLAATLLFVLAPHAVARLFGTPTNIPNPDDYWLFAEKTFRIFLSLTTFTCIVKVSSIFFQAAGKPVRAVVASMVRDILCFIPLILILPRFFGIEGILYAAPAADLLAMLVSGALMIGYFRQLGKDVPAAEAE